MRVNDFGCIDIEEACPARRSAATISLHLRRLNTCSRAPRLFASARTLAQINFMLVARKYDRHGAICTSEKILDVAVLALQNLVGRFLRFRHALIVSADGMAAVVSVGIP